MLRAPRLAPRLQGPAAWLHDVLVPDVAQGGQRVPRGRGSGASTPVPRAVRLLGQPHVRRVRGTAGPRLRERRARAHGGRGRDHGGP